LNVEDLTPDPYNRYYTGYSETPWYSYKLKIAELRDSTGNLLVEKGTGHVVAFDDDFKKVLEEGDIKNNKKEGEWRGPIADSGKFICVYHNDKLKSGVSYMKSGSHYNFKQLHTDAVFKDGIAAFQLFIRNNLQFPESAKKHNVSGSVSVGFFIEPNGSLSEIKVVKSLVKSVDDEAIRVINLSPLWIPATEYGISIRTYQWVPVYFFNL
jgi:TonB family protein